MENILLVNSDRDKSIYYVVDTVNKVVRPIQRTYYGISEIEGFNVDTHTYSGDSISLGDSWGTLAYVNNEYNFYGILTEYSKSIAVIWISKSNAEKDPKFDKVCNKYGKLIDITDQGLKVLDSTWKNKLKNRILTDSLKTFPCNQREFYRYIGIETESKQAELTVERGNGIEDSILKINVEAQKQDDTYECIIIEPETTIDGINVKKEVEQKEEIEEPDKGIAEYTNNLITEASEEQPLENNEEIVENSEDKTSDEIEDENTNKKNVNIDEMFSAYMSNIETRLIEVVKREEEIAIREAELIKASNKINSILANVDSYSVNNIVDVLVGVDLIASNSVVKDNKFTDNDYCYEMILKMLHVDDYITIPFEFYRKLKPIPKLILESNKGWSSHKAIEEIAFDKGSKKTLIGVVECDETTGKVTILILKPYNTDKMLDNQLKDFLVQYAKWRKDKMTSNSAE